MGGQPQGGMSSISGATPTVRRLPPESPRSHLEAAVQSRTRIATAIGILIERDQVDRPRVFAVLTRFSHHSNRKRHILGEENVLETESGRRGRLQPANRTHTWRGLPVNPNCNNAWSPADNSPKAQSYWPDG